MKPADKPTGTPAAAAPGAESAEVRKPSIHAGLRAGGECGKSAEEVRNLYLSSDLAGHSLPPALAAAHSLPPRFRLAMPDDAMAPKTPRGTVLIFSTAAPPSIGAGVLAQDAEGRRHVRRYAQGIGGGWVAEARSGAYRPLHSGTGLQLLAVMVGRETGEV